jgi:hypothetical protein
MMDDLTINDIRDLKRQLYSIEHMIYVSCKFTKTTEMLRRVMETIVSGYEQFFGVAYRVFVKEDDMPTTVHDKIQILKDGFLSRGISIDLSDYFLLKRLLLSEFECIGEYRKNLCMVAYIDGEEYIVNIMKLLDFYSVLKDVIDRLNIIQLT